MATLAQFQQLLLWQLGDSLPGAPNLDPGTVALMAGLSAQIGTVWSIGANKATSPTTVPLYAKREAIELLRGQLRTKRDASLGPLNTRAEALWTHLTRLYEDTQKEIERLEKRLASQVKPAVGPILATAPRMDAVTQKVTVRDVDGIKEATVETVEVRPDPANPRYTPGPLEGGGRVTPPGMP